MTGNVFFLVPLGDGVFSCFTYINITNHTHMLHAWYIYLQNWAIYGVNGGKYSIHGAYGIVNLE